MPEAPLNPEISGKHRIPVKGPGESEYPPSPMEAEATRLMTAAKHGDRDAFDSLVESVRDRAFFVARGLVGSREDALDLSQEAFLKTFRARDTYRDGEPFLPWFHRILKNTCFSFLRKHGRLRKHSLAGTGDSADESGEWQIADPAAPSPSERGERSETVALFWQGFNKLSARDREILSLRHFKELPYQEIADTLGIPVGTVMSRLFHARRRLRDQLGSSFEGLPHSEPPESQRDGDSKTTGEGRRATRQTR